MCSLNFNHYYLLWRYDNIFFSDVINSKSFEIFLYHLYIVVVGKSVELLMGRTYWHVRAIKKHGQMSNCPWVMSMIVLSLTDRYRRSITEAAEVNGGIWSFTHILQYLIISKMRTRHIVNLNVLEIKLIEKCDIQVVIKIFAVIMIIVHTKIVN